MARRKKLEVSEKALGLFDHVKHIRTIQDANYYCNLSDNDKKSFNHFMILRALSMNPELVDLISTLYKYFDIIPSAQFYTMLISVVPPDRTFYPWIKPVKTHSFTQELIELISNKFEVSCATAIEYITLLKSVDGGLIEIEQIVRGYGNDQKTINKIMEGIND